VTAFIRRIVTGHNEAGKSVVVSDGTPPQKHEMRRPSIGADFFENVQLGTNHAWENRSDNVARMAFFHVNAEFSEELLDNLPKPLELLR